MHPERAAPLTVHICPLSPTKVSYMGPSFSPKPPDHPSDAERLLPILGRSSASRFLLLSEPRVVGRAFLFSPNPMPKRRSAVHDPQLKKLRALMMVQFRVRNNASIAEVAKEFGVSEKTVHRQMAWVKRAGVIAEMEDKILTELMPEAHKAIKVALQDDEHKQEAGRLGIELFKGVVPGFKKAANAGPIAQVNELERYLEEIRSESGDIIDGEVEGTTLRLEPPAAQSAPAEGDAEPVGRNTTGNSTQSPESSSVGLGSGEGSS